jgi:hypothetical protein
MRREFALLGALVPAPLGYFLLAVAIFIVVDRLLTMADAYRLLWHPSLVRLGLFVILFSALALLESGP